SGRLDHRCVHQDPDHADQQCEREVRAVMRLAAEDRERGAVLLLATLLMTALLGIAALVVDLGVVRSQVRVDQSVADFAALAGAKGLAANNPPGACQSAIQYVNQNASLSSAIDGSTFCSTMGSTRCSGGAGQATPSATSAADWVSIRYPARDA